MFATVDFLILSIRIEFCVKFCFHANQINKNKQKNREKLPKIFEIDVAIRHYDVRMWELDSEKKPSTNDWNR